MTIWKFEINLFQTIIELPAGYKIIDVQEQNGNICLWAIVDPNNELSKVETRAIGTGMNVPEGYNYLSTVQQGVFVWHIFFREFRQC
jgi:hypothetical protein